MSDTPETDAFIASQNHSPTTHQLKNFARILERERDEARDELRDIRLNLGADAEGYTLVHAVCGIQNERDEAREQIKELIYIGERAIALAEIDFENDKFGVVTELREALMSVKMSTSK